MAASRRNRYYKNLSGLNAQGFFSPASTNYTSATTLAGFVNGVGAGTITNGTIAIINATTNAVITGALSAGTKFFIAQALDGSVKKSTIMTFGGSDLEIKKTAYTAPVLQQTIIGYNGTSGVIGTIIPTAGNTKTLALSIRDTSPATQPFPVQAGSVTVKNSAATEFDAVAALVSDLMNVGDFEANSDGNFARVEIITNGTPTAIATVTATCLEGSDVVTYSGAHTLVVGDILNITLNGVTRAYKAAEILSSTVVRLDRPFAGTSGTTAGGGTAKVATITELGIVITAYVQDTCFVVSKGNDLVDATVTNVTAWKLGSGAAWQVSALEAETQVMSGYTTGNEAFAADYGKPTSFVSETEATTFDLWFLKYKNTTPSMAYMNQNTEHVGYVVIAAPSSGTTAADELVTILGV
jgi:hypothetical protein